MHVTINIEHVIIKSYRAVKHRSVYQSKGSGLRSVFL